MFPNQKDEAVVLHPVNDMALDLRQLCKAKIPVVINLSSVKEIVLGKLDFVGNDYIVVSSIPTKMNSQWGYFTGNFESVRFPLSTIQFYRPADEEEKELIQETKEAEEAEEAEEAARASQKPSDS